MKKPTATQDMRGTLKAARTRDGQLRLAPDMLPSGAVADLISRLPGQAIVLESAEIVPDRGPPTGTIAISGRVVGQWPVPYFDGAALNQIALEATFRDASAGQPATSSLRIVRASLTPPTGGISVQGRLQPTGELLFQPVEGEPPVPVDMAAVAATLIGSTDAAAMMRGGPFSVSVPLSELSFTIGLGPTPFTEASVASQAAGQWPVLPGGLLTLADPRIAAKVTRQVDAGLGRRRNSRSATISARALLGSVPLEVEFDLSDGPVLEIDLSPPAGAAFPGLAEVSGLVGGESLSGSVRSGLQALGLDTVSVTSINFGVDWASGRLAWAALGGGFMLAGGRIRTTMHLVPSFRMVAELDDSAETGAPGTKIQLDAIAGSVLGDSAGLPAVALDGLSIFADPGASAYRMTASVDGACSWKIADSGPTLALRDLSVIASRESGTTRGDVVVAWSIGGFDLVLSGKYQGAGAGWQFFGSASQAEPVDAGALLKDLGSKLGADVPDAVAAAVSSLRVTELEAGFDTHDRLFSFAAAIEAGGQVPIGFKSFELALRLSLTSQSGDDGKRSLAGHFEADFDVGDASFLVSYDFGSTRVIRGKWSSRDGETISLSDIADAIGLDAVVEVPGGLDVALTSAAFEYRSESESFTLSATSSSFGDAFFTVAKGADGKRGFVFGLESPKGGKLSDLPGIGSALGAADFLAIEQATIILSSNSLSDFVIPALPPVPAPTTGGQAGRAIAARPINPLATGMKLQLSTGLSLVAMIDLGASSDPVIGNLRTIVGTSKLALQVAIGPSSLSLFAGLPGTIGIPTGTGSKLTLSDPTIRIDLGAVPSFQVSGSVGFSISGTPVHATARLLLSAIQAQVAMTLAADQGALPAPPGIKGLHLEEFGISLGVFFTPPAVDLGVQGRFRIGEEQALRPDQFAFVLQIIEEVPNLLYLSFYIDKMDLGQAVTLFTDGSEPDVVSSLEIVKASNLSFHWSEMPVVLPDGTVAKPGFGFSAAIDILSFGAFAELEVGDEGLHGMAEMAPINLMGVLQVTGDGKGMYRSYEEVDGVWKQVDNDSVIRSIPARPTRRDAIVAAGGPVIQFNSVSSPFVHISCEVSLFDKLRESVEVTVASSGLTFALSYDIAGIEKFDMHCTLSADKFEADARFGFHLDASIGPIRVAGIDMGSIHLSAGFDAAIKVAIDGSRFALELGGGFSFSGIGLTLPTLTINVPFASLGSLPGYAIAQIQQFADEIFASVLSDVGRYAQMIADGIVTGVTDLAATLKSAFNVTAEEAAKLMKLANQSAEAVAAGLRNAYGETAEAAATMIRGAGYAANQVASALGSGYGLAADGAAAAMRGAGYAAGEVGGALNSAYGTTTAGAASALRGAGYAASEVATGLNQAFGAGAGEVAGLLKGLGYNAMDAVAALNAGIGVGSEAVSGVLRGAGYEADEIGGVLNNAYGATGDFAAGSLRQVGATSKEVAIMLGSAYGMGAQQAANTLRQVGFAADEVGEAMRDAYDASAEVAAQTLRGAGYAAAETASALRSGWGTTAAGGAVALRGAGYAVDETGNALRSGWGATADGAAGALRGAGYAVNETGTFLKNSFGLAPDGLNAALSGAGYAADQVKGFFGSLGGSFASFFEGAGGAVVKALDPTGW